MRSSRLLATTVAAASLCLGAAAFYAAPAGANAECDARIEAGFVTDAAGNSVITNYVNARSGEEAGCVVTSHSPVTGSSALVTVIANPGWTYKVKSAGGAGSGSKVAVDFANASLKLKSSYMIRAGKVVSG
jgi:hypothetical protein